MDDIKMHRDERGDDYWLRPSPQAETARILAVYDRMDELGVGYPHGEDYYDFTDDEREE